MNSKLHFLCGLANLFCLIVKIIGFKPAISESFTEAPWFSKEFKVS